MTDKGKEQLKKEFIDYYVNNRDKESMLNSLGRLFDKYYSQLESKDKELVFFSERVQKLDSERMSLNREIARLTDQLRAADEVILAVYSSNASVPSEHIVRINNAVEKYNKLKP